MNSSFQKEQRTPTLAKPPKDLQELKRCLAQSLRFAMPSWPLQNTVAVNPFWDLKDLPFATAMERGREVYGASLIDADAGSPALQIPLPSSLLSESLARALKDSLGKYCAAYFDHRQAIAKNPYQPLNFARFWRETMAHDRAFMFLGLASVKNVLRLFDQHAPLTVIDLILSDMGLFAEDERTALLSRLVGQWPGWCSQFRYVEWQSSLGYKTDSRARSEDFVLVALAYEYVVYLEFRVKRPLLAADWRRRFETALKRMIAPPKTTALVKTLGAELSHQDAVAAALGNISRTHEQPVEAQLVFCIDVRSERVRRHLELANPSLRTLGFAGFFGLPLELHESSGGPPSRRLPVLLSASLKAVKAPPAERATVSEDAEALGTFLRRLRKGAFSSTLYIEIFGLFHMLTLFRGVLHRAERLVRDRLWPARLHATTADSRLHLQTLSGESISLKHLVTRAESALKHMGLTERFAPFVFVVGHGSHTTNNAFGSALNCGACGGHAGDVNARLLVDCLNQREVRAGLRARGIVIPEETIFVAALHETVTDEIHVLGADHLSEDALARLTDLRASFRRASEACRAERLARQGAGVNLDSDFRRRARNWAEVRPEWGLAGNSSFIIAPRTRTATVDLSARAFLHEYDWSHDAPRGFETLELIMTAPMVVTHWINMQYYASTVAPSVFSAGNKVLHNLVNETGVVEGNGGDLRIGLPLQSIHDGQRFVHEPLRLSVFIEAPEHAIEAILAKHAHVRALVINQWLHLLRIESASGQVYRRSPSGEYVALQPLTEPRPKTCTH